MANSPLRRAVFLDRDGTLNRQTVREGKPYSPDRPDDLVLFEDVVEGCRHLKEAGYLLVVATNQPDVGRGRLAQSVVESMHVRLRELLPMLDHIEVCYDPGQGMPSRRRKPAPGMLLDAAKLLNLDLPQSWMIGDRWRDVDCGHAAGCRTVFLDWEYEEELHTAPDFTVRSFGEAAAIVLAAPKT